MTRRSVRRLGALGAALVALVLAHSLVFLIRYGSLYGEGLAHSGHDVAWTIAVVSSIGLGLGLALAGVIQLARLARVARVRGSSPVSASGPSLARRWLTTATGLSATTGVLLTIQENLERWAAGLPTPGIGLVLSPDYPWATLVIAVTGLLVAFVVALFRWRREVLLARIGTIRAAPRRAVSDPRPAWIEPDLAASALGRALGLRAPPSPLAG